MQEKHASESIQLWDCVLEDDEKLRALALEGTKEITLDRYKKITHISFLNYKIIIEIKCHEVMQKDADRVKSKLKEINIIREKYIMHLQKWFQFNSENPKIYEIPNIKQIAMEICVQIRSIVVRNHFNQFDFLVRSLPFLEKYYELDQKCVEMDKLEPSYKLSKISALRLKIDSNKFIRKFRYVDIVVKF